MHDQTVRRRRLVLAALVAACLILLTASFGSSSSNPLSSVQRGVFEVVSPIQDGASRALKPLRDLFGWVGDTFDAKGENDDLRSERDELRRENARLQAARRQIDNLRRQLRMNRELSLDEMGPVPARVSGSSPSLFYRRITINKGSGDGLAVDQPVVNGSGLVGRVSEVSGGAAIVTLLTDSTFRAGATIAESGVQGIAKPVVGSPGRLEVEGTTSRDEVSEGQIVVTQGTDPESERFASLFPPDVPIGEVTRVEEPGTDAQEVYVRPFVEVRRLDNVQVLTRPADPDATP